MNFLDFCALGEWQIKSMCGDDPGFLHPVALNVSCGCCVVLRVQVVSYSPSHLVPRVLPAMVGMVCEELRAQ